MAGEFIILNPEIVYVGGTLGQVGPLLLSRVEEEVKSRALISNRSTIIKAAPVDSVALGAAGMALAQAVDLLPTTI